MKIFSGSASKQLTEDVAKTLTIPLSLIDVHIFPDGERRIRIHDTVAGKQTVVLQTASTPVDTNYMELFFIIDALKRAGAKSITAVIPYFGYQRQDHLFRNGEAVSLEVVIEFLEHIGVTRLISVDMHSDKIPSLFHIPVSHISALPLFANEIKKQKWNTNETILVSPDTGGLHRVKKLSELLDELYFLAIEKNRDRATGAITMGQIKTNAIDGKKRAIIVDDMISSGATIIMSASLLRQQGIEEVIVFTTHPVFSIDAPGKLQNAPIDVVYGTDTVTIPPDKQFAKLKILSIADSIAKEIKQSMRKKKL